MMESSEGLNELMGLFTSPSSRWFSLYLLASGAIAYGVFRVDARHDPEVRAEGFVRYLFPPEAWKHPSSKADLRFFFINKLLFAVFFGQLVLSSTVMQGFVSGRLDTWFGAGGYGAGPGVATLVTTLVTILAADFGLWFGHYLLHRVPVLWEFHKVHHSAEVLTPFTAGRVHPMEDVMNMTFSGVCGGLVYGLCSHAFGEGALMLGVLQVNVIMFLFYVLGFHLRHSHVWVAYTGVWGRVFISPAHHQIHHSIARRHWDRNMGFVFAIWDWMFGTLWAPDVRERITIGMNGIEDSEYHSVRAMYLLPFIKAWRLITGRAAPDPANPPAPAE